MKPASRKEIIGAVIFVAGLAGFVSLLYLSKFAFPQLQQWITLGLLVCSPVMIGFVVWRVFQHRRQMAVGTEIASFKGSVCEDEADYACCQGDFSVTTSQQWCRVVLAIDIEEVIEKTFTMLGGERHDSIRQHPYTLILSSAPEQPLYQETGNLRPFFRTAIGSGRRRYHKSRFRGEATFLEFIPPGPGRYHLKLKVILCRERGGASQIRTKINALGAYIKESVVPLESSAFPHNRVIISLMGNTMVAQRDDSGWNRLQ